MLALEILPLLAVRTAKTLLFSFLTIGMCGGLHPQAGGTIKIQMLDSQTGKPITTSEFQVWVNRAIGATRARVTPKEDGVAEVKLDPDVSVIAVHAEYAIDRFYANCDAEKDRGPYLDHWYSVSEILAAGIAAPNNCNKKKGIAKPGYFVFFVRRQHWWEEMRE